MTREKKKEGKKRPTPQRRELKLEELHAIVEKARVALSASDHETLKAAVDTLGFLTRELESKGVSIRRLRKLLFGASTEKTSQVVGEASTESGTGANGGASEDQPKKKRKGHGRNGADAYRGAERVKVSHETLENGDPCLKCEGGKVYTLSAPAVLVRVMGMAPLRATVYELERLRCNLCGEVFTAQAPGGVGEVKYDETAASMIALLKYGCGLPFYRLERLQRDLGIPLPAATQWEVVHRASENLWPAYEELIRQAAQGEVIHNDDTTMKILELVPSSEEKALRDGRTGVFTSGIVSTGGGHQIAAFFTGRQHAGENLSDVLKRRAANRSPPIQMCDALSRNTSDDFNTILANCNAHARRRFVDVADNFPEECRHVLEQIGKVYHNDAIARERGLSPEERLLFHQSESGPLMDRLKGWLDEQIETKKVEPNGSLGEAIVYMRKHWEKLTLFLRKAGAPLDNNLCERALKKAILHRKNSMFYKTENGARVGDLFMSLIHTAELCEVDPFSYLVETQRHHHDVVQSPGDWMPWNYAKTLARLSDRRPTR